MSLGLILPAAGLGTRLGADIPKALVPLSGEPLITHTCRALAALPNIAAWVVLAPAGFEGQIDAAVRTVVLGTDMSIDVRAGGAERADSVLIGLSALPKKCDIVAVHDAARPCVSPTELRAVVEAGSRTGAAILARPCSDTVKRSEDGVTITQTLDRSGVWLAQTPQVFHRTLLTEALEQSRDVTDEAMAVEALGRPVTLVPGRTENIKITTEADLIIAAQLLGPPEARCASD